MCACARAREPFLRRKAFFLSLISFVKRIWKIFLTFLCWRESERDFKMSVIIIFVVAHSLSLSPEEEENRRENRREQKRAFKRRRRRRRIRTRSRQKRVSTVCVFVCIFVYFFLLFAHMLLLANFSPHKKKILTFDKKTENTMMRVSR